MSEVKWGDVREDGFIFVGYRKHKDKRYECWTCPAAFERKREKLNASNKGRYSRMSNEQKAQAISNTKKWKALNPENVKATRTKSRVKLHSCPLYRLKHNVRARTYLAVKGKTKSTSKYIGCSWDELVSWLECKFKPGMTWDNYGKWHVDHVVPLASAKSLDDLLPLLRFENLQPLWAMENILKGCK